MPTDPLISPSGQRSRPGVFSAATDGARRPTAVTRWLLVLGAVAAPVAALVWRQERAHLSPAADQTELPVRLSVPTGTKPRMFPLADGSRVMLAPGSELSSDAGYGHTTRTVRLAGEALFTVADGQLPFVVVANGVRVEDVSATFAVRALAGGPTGAAPTLVAVTEGEVRVHRAGGVQRLTEGHALLVDSAGHVTLLDDRAGRASVAWTSGALLFTDEPVVSVLERLRRWTGLRIAVDSGLYGRRVSLALEAESPEGAVLRFAEALGVRAEASGAGWTLSSR